MSLKEYFEKTKGIGILSTADAQGNVDSAIYNPPEVFDDETIALNMMEKLSYQNINANPKACYLFRENCDGFQGKRLYLAKIEDNDETEHVAKVKSLHPEIFKNNDKKKHQVVFKVENVRPLTE